MFQKHPPPDFSQITPWRYEFSIRAILPFRSRIILLLVVLTLQCFHIWDDNMINNMTPWQISSWHPVTWKEWGIEDKTALKIWKCGLNSRYKYWSDDSRGTDTKSCLGEVKQSSYSLQGLLHSIRHFQHLVSWIKSSSFFWSLMQSTRSFQIKVISWRLQSAKGEQIRQSV